MRIRYDQDSRDSWRSGNGKGSSYLWWNSTRSPYWGDGWSGLYLQGNSGGSWEEAGRNLLKIVPIEADVVVVGSWAEKWCFVPLQWDRQYTSGFLAKLHTAKIKQCDSYLLLKNFRRWTERQISNPLYTVPQSKHSITYLRESDFVLGS